MTLGIDVSKNYLDCCLKGVNQKGILVTKATKKFKNDENGFQSMIVWLKGKTTEGKAILCVMEATGTYHEDVLYYLYEHKYNCVLVLPNKIFHYARSLNKKAKTDKIDAELIADYGAKNATEFSLWFPVTKNIKRIKEFSRSIEDVNAQLVENKNYLHALKIAHNTNPKIIKLYENLIEKLEKMKLELESSLDKEIETDSEMKRMAEESAKIKGLTVRSVARVLAEVNCFLSTTSIRKAISYAGLDIIVKQSGSSCFSSSISKRGNKHLRNILFMSALSSAIYDEHNKDLRQRLLERGHKPIECTVSVMRKLLIIIFVLTKYNRKYDPNYNWHNANHIPT